MLPPPRLVRKGGELRGIYHFSYCHCCGWCNLPLHHQMVGRWQIVGSQPVELSLSTPKNRNRKPRCWNTGVFVLKSNCMDFSFLFAYWHYSICKIQIQYTKIRYWSIFLNFPYTILIILFLSILNLCYTNLIYLCDLKVTIWQPICNQRF